MSRSFRLAILLFTFGILSISALAEGLDQYTVNISENKFLGSFLVNQSGFTLYYYSADSQGNGGSTCYGECASLWPPFFAKELTLPESLNSANFATITRTDGLKQTTFRGWPLYLYAKDAGAGDTFGKGVEGWQVVNPADVPQFI